MAQLRTLGLPRDGQPAKLVLIMHPCSRCTGCGARTGAQLLPEDGDTHIDLQSTDSEREWAPCLSDPLQSCICLLLFVMVFGVGYSLYQDPPGSHLQWVQRPE